MKRKWRVKWQENDALKKASSTQPLSVTVRAVVYAGNACLSGRQDSDMHYCTAEKGWSFQKSLPYLEPQRSAPPWETRPHLLKPGGRSGVWSRLPAEREGSRAWGAGLGNWLWPEQVHCRRFLLASPLAFRCGGCCQGNSRQPFPGPAQAHQSLLFLLAALGI